MLLYSVEPKKVNVEIEAPEFIVINEDFSLNVTLIDSDTGNVMDDSMLIGQTLTGEVKARRRARLQGNTRFTVQDGDMSSFTIDGLRVGKALKLRLSLKGRVSPADITVVGFSDFIPVLDFVMPENATSVTIKMRVKGIKSKGVKKHKATFENKALAEIQNIGNVYWHNPEVITGKKLLFSVDAQGSEAELTAAIQSLCMKLKMRKIKFKINRRTITFQKMKVDNGKWFSCKARRFIEVQQFVNE
ncbi:uncharacterized protein LOC122250591 [Penaeus japonicus]|uniref:uncharacterized protein LOC122250591 n=1 Tax=Penaeus japonicus TaxID=27405 RepID=UPI001C71349E|nr:uncharacterized protein LOC122250591 [Penaeus japonicus]